MKNKSILKQTIPFIFIFRCSGKNFIFMKRHFLCKSFMLIFFFQACRDLPANMLHRMNRQLVTWPYFSLLFKKFFDTFHS